MRITFPSPGEARYSFYSKETDNKGNIKKVKISTRELKDRLWKEKVNELFSSPSLPIPGLVPGGVLVPAI
ncbi:hypothetical protein D3C87_1153930 [compost metagenome]